MKFSLEPRMNAGLLLLRLGVGGSFVLLFTMKSSEAAKIFVEHPGQIWPLAGLSAAALLVTCGAATRLAATCASLAWTLALYSGLEAHEPWYALPVRSALYVILFATLTITGAGRFSVDSWFERYVIPRVKDR